MTTAREVIQRRRDEQRSLVERARRHVDALERSLDLRAAVVVGSVARGDFHSASDIDLVVVVADLPAAPSARWRLVAARGGRVQPVAWTPAEFAAALGRRNPLAVDALDHGIWIVGSPDDVAPGA